MSAPRTELLQTSANRKSIAVPVDHISSFEASDKYVTAVLEGGREMLLGDTLKALEVEFAGDFMRIHRSILVRINEANRLYRDNDQRVWLFMRGRALALPVSRRHVSALRAQIAGL